LLDREEGYEKAGANRVYIWLRTIDLIKESPWVGYGLENLESVFVEKYSEEMMEIYGKIYLVDRAHNEYLHIAVSSGIPALIAYLIFIVLCLKKGYELTKRDIRYLPYFTAISAYLVQAFFNISVVSVAYIFWIFLGVITNENVFEDEAPTI
jgi:putative inorganic carbon (HCO3(-)) transporter